jgi:hypothetical protein
MSESADSFGLNAVLVKQVENRLASQASALGVQRGGAAIHIVVALSAGRELEVAKAEAEAGEQREQLLGVCGSGHRLRFYSSQFSVVSSQFSVLSKDKKHQRIKMEEVRSNQHSSSRREVTIIAQSETLGKLASKRDFRPVRAMRNTCSAAGDAQTQ